jgi:hypothetical protein
LKKKNFVYKNKKLERRTKLRIFLLKRVVFSVILTIFVLIYGCSDNTTNPTPVTYDAYSIDGTITFVDTNFISDTTPTADITDGQGVGNINFNAYMDNTYKLAKY